MHDQPRHVEGLEQQVGSEGRLEVRDADVLADLVITGRVPASLVELAVGGQVGLRRHAEQLAAVDHDGAVVEAVAVAQRCAHHEHGEEILGCRHQRRDGGLDRVEHGILHHEIVDRVPGQAQLGEHRDGDGIGVALACRGKHRFRVADRVGDRDGDRAGRDAREPVAVRALEREAHGTSLSGRGLLCRGCRCTTMVAVDRMSLGEGSPAAGGGRSALRWAGPPEGGRSERRWIAGGDEAQRRSRNVDVDEAGGAGPLE